MMDWNNNDAEFITDLAEHPHRNVDLSRVVFILEAKCCPNGIDEHNPKADGELIMKLGVERF